MLVSSMLLSKLDPPDCKEELNESESCTVFFIVEFTHI